MPGDASLARLFREYGRRWEIERVQRGAEWVACLRDGKYIEIVSARDLAALRREIETTERELAAEKAAPVDPA